VAPADARNAIMEAAVVLFAERGFHGTTMRDIAERARVSQGLLHHHFGNKEGLWRTAGEHLSADFMAYVAAVLKPDRFNLWRLLNAPARCRS
jgi:AcrR family transcriptional regulator